MSHPPPVNVPDLPETLPPPADVTPVPGRPAAVRYELGAEIARGGMGVVYRVRDTNLDRDLAVKVLLADPRDRPDLAARFAAEAKLTAGLQHPGVVPVHETGTFPDGRSFFAMKLVRGRTLADLLADLFAARSSPADDLSRFVDVFLSICRTVGYAHAAGVIHRDLKPANVMVGDFGEVQVMDWGLATVLGSGERESAVDPPHGSAMGTPGYMSPEQARGESDKLDTRSDVFSLGAILCQVLTGIGPFGDGSAEVLTFRAAQGLLGPAREMLAGCGADPELTGIAGRCLSTDAADRPADAGAVAELVAAYRAGVDARLRRAEAERAAAEATTAGLRKRQKLRLALAGAVVTILFGVGGVGWWADHQAAERKFQERQVREGVEAARKLAVDLRKKYRFGEAADVLEQAAGQLAGGLADDLKPVLKQAQSDLAFVRELDDIRMRKVTWIAEGGGKGTFDWASLPAEYRRAFQSRGIDVAVESPADVAARITASPIRQELVDALDDWSMGLFRSEEPDSTLLNRLLEVARLADPGPWKDRLRNPAVRVDRDQLEQLATDAVAVGLSSGALEALVDLMWLRGLDATKFLTAPKSLDAARVLTAALDRTPSDFRIACRLGLMYNYGDPQRAIGYYRIARAIRPDSIPVLTNLGTLLLDAKDVDGAIACHRDAIRADPTFSPAYTNLASALRAKRDLTEAVVYDREAVRLDPGSAPAHCNLGITFLQSNDRSGAIVSFREAIRLDPKLVRAHCNLGIALTASNDLSGAITSFREAIRLDPNDSSAHSSLGVAMRASNDLPGAIASFREAIRLDPKPAPPHSKLGVALAESNDLPGAIASFREAIRLDPTIPWVHSNLGTGLRDCKDLPGAIASFREAIRLDPKFSMAHYNLGVVLRDTNDLAGAIASFREAIRLDPKLIAAHHNLGYALRKSNDLAGAIASLREAIRLDPKDVWAYSHLGDALREQGDLPGAVASFRELLRINPKDANAHHDLGNALREQGDLTSAAEAFAEATRLDPNLIAAKESLELVRRKIAETRIAAREIAPPPRRAP